MKKSKKSIIEPVHIEEAKKLKSLYEAYIARKKLDGERISQEAFGAMHGIGNQSMVWQYLNARSPLNAEAARKFSLALQCDVREFSPRLADWMSNFAYALSTGESSFSFVNGEHAANTDEDVFSSSTKFNKELPEELKSPEIEAVVVRLDLEDLANKSLAFASKMADELRYLEGSYSYTDENPDPVKLDLSEHLEEANDLVSLAALALKAHPSQDPPTRIKLIIHDLLMLRENAALLDAIETVLVMARHPDVPPAGESRFKPGRRYRMPKGIAVPNTSIRGRRVTDHQK